jgi:hypothetical protein
MKGMYYNRVMDSSIETLVKDKYQWLIHAVIENPELDFQTGSNASDSWFSVYRGTGKVASISKGNGYKMSAHPEYMALYPAFYDSPTPQTFAELLRRISNDRYFDSYYQSADKKMEGFYQNLISRRYTIDCKLNDDFIIVDKEFVIGYKDQDTKDRYLDKYRRIYDGYIRKIKEQYLDERWPRNIEQTGEECDFLALSKTGDIILLELKHKGSLPNKIYLSPLQVGKYADMAQDLLNESSDTIYNVLKEMVEQKKRIGIMYPVWDFPPKFSGIIRTAVIVGGDSSDNVKRKYKKVRDIVGKNTPYYICDNNGTLIEIKL